MISYETPWRSIIKAVGWRLLASLTTFLIVYFATGELVLSTSVGVLELLIKIILYFFYERIWNLTSWGRK
ncbi:MAG: hypothetical protein A2927_00775 [Candidatus Komeilibacteria bacterium RIFCSPLOWO2_01_FULL_45_10]|uniref:DUF2061 domain-containing protein n=1 Tax=Candidatus Komeilibacteria bacterium RIFCSPLOWO2_01_FULL_45_10 TaxID=1798550 RepID=A0A1G2BJJ1_9BACT|nr:MAG: hypothetical protein A2927_00775 [Candidatus Komeilibacteria bacterium RIFCSPLOWO2_01_FULL_45_10]